VEKIVFKITKDINKLTGRVDSFESKIHKLTDRIDVLGLEFKNFKNDIKDFKKQVINIFMWQSGLIAAAFSGLYLKLFLG